RGHHPGEQRAARRGRDGRPRDRIRVERTEARAGPVERERELDPGVREDGPRDLVVGAGVAVRVAEPAHRDAELVAQTPAAALDLLALAGRVEPGEDRVVDRVAADAHPGR